MTWFKVDDGFWSHPKTSGLSAIAVALWVKAGTYSCQHLTDGLIRYQVLKLLGTRKAANELVAAELWHEVDGGWVFHDWSEYQEMSDDVRKRRDDARERQRKSREERERKRRESQEMSQRDGEVTGNVTSEEVFNPRPDPTRPDPTSSSSGDLGGAGHLPNRASPDAAPPGNRNPNNPRCPKHAHIPIDDRGPNCRACRAHREWLESEPTRRSGDRSDRAEARRSAIANCSLCGDDGFVLGPDGLAVEPLVKCTHGDRRIA